MFFDCSRESPEGRRSLCYDRKALESRKAHKPKDRAIDMAEAMGVELLREEQYRALQKLGEFDLKNFELGEDSCGDQKTRWRSFL